MAATPMNSDAWVELNKTGLRQVFIQRGMERPREYPFFVNVDTLDHVPAFDYQVHGIGLMGEMPEGSGFPRASMTLGGRREWTVRPYGIATEITYIERRDEQYGTFDQIPSMQAQAGRQREEEDACYFLNNAFDTSVNGFVAGEALCGTHTSVVNGEVQTNEGTAGTPSQTAIQQALTYFHNLKNDDGTRCYKQPSTILAGPTLNYQWLLRELLGSTGRPFSADNELNSLMAEGLSYMILHFGDFGSDWFIECDEHDFWFMWRDAPFADTFKEPNTMNAVQAAYQRHSRGEFRDYHGIYGFQGPA